MQGLTLTKYDLKLENWNNHDEKWKQFKAYAIASLKGSDKNINQGGDNFNGFDYGLIQNKKCLFQRGAENLKTIANLIPDYQTNVIGSDGKFAVWVECTLYFNNSPIGKGVGGGVGEPETTMGTKRIGLDFAFNKAVQMARKRSLVSAIRTVFNLVGEFTQDIEEETMEEIKQKRNDEKLSKIKFMIEYCKENKDYFHNIIFALKNNDGDFDKSQITVDGKVIAQMVGIKIQELPKDNFALLWKQIPLKSRKEWKEQYYKEQEAGEEDEWNSTNN